MNHTDAFTDAISGVYTADYILPTSSGTGALLSALAACSLSLGDEVIIPVNACAIVLNSIIATGATPIFCDVDNHMQMSAVTLSEAVTVYTKVIIAVHHYGSSCNLNDMRVFLDSINYDGFFIEDGAQAFGLQNTAFLKPNGCTDIYITSFSRGKIIDVDGGGLILTNNEEIYHKAFRFAHYGADKVPYFLGCGLNFHMPKPMMTLITAEISNLYHNIINRIKNAEAMITVFNESGLIAVQDHANCVYNRLILRIPEAFQLQNLVNALGCLGYSARAAFAFLLTEYAYIKTMYPVQSSQAYPNALWQKERFLCFYTDARFDNTLAKALVDLMGK
jgi:dTDP-4-amino-4,6-dideoxygalactose transaminase